ncbi:MAG: tRNA preQ1(34) S-adenosylmethionine ribosyltransferase-isomerase QueA [Ignavibacteriales bacterium]|nr:tRNA preQ1(34) S-adenosylmethionine ribosyltransferase-isomerase QueA [Ignavibacteriales bacterium]
MKLSDFRYPLPRNLIAKFPASPRDAARLMVLDRKTEKIEHHRFRDIIDYFESGDSLVVNETQVFQARLFGHKEKTRAHIEVFLLRELNHEEAIWDAIVDPARKVRIGNKIYFDDDKLWCEVIDNTTSRGRTVRFNYKGDLYKVCERIGAMPLPQYIKRDATVKDIEDYQTIFARHIGSVAAPTAGLHFTPRLIKQLEKKGVKTAPITLHLGLGSFRPVEVEDLHKHKMDSEYFEVPESSAKIVNASIDAKCNVYVCGTSSARAAESATTADGHLKAIKMWTDKFIFPPYDFRVTDRMITNFHMPESTLLMLVSAFGGRDFIMNAYKTAIKMGYRFYSYGDAMLII